MALLVLRPRWFPHRLLMAAASSSRFPSSPSLLHSYPSFSPSYPITYRCFFLHSLLFPFEYYHLSNTNSWDCGCECVLCFIYLLGFTKYCIFLLLKSCLEVINLYLVLIQGVKIILKQQKFMDLWLWVGFMLHEFVGILLKIAFFVILFF